MRACYAALLHLLNPMTIVRRHLMDPVPIFVKAEGHDEGKVTSKRWRLIWNVSEPDRLINCLLHQEHDDIDDVRFRGEVPSFNSGHWCGDYVSVMQRVAEG